MRDKVERLLDRLRTPPEVMIPLYTQGQCYALFLILREVFPDAMPFYSMSEGHVYTRINNRFYDIRGKHLRPPDDLSPLRHDIDDPPHRWGQRIVRLEARPV